jgi:hypothetical protein
MYRSSDFSSGEIKDTIMSPYENAWLVSNMFSSHSENVDGTRVNGSGWLCCTLIGDHQHDVPEAAHWTAHV